MKIRANEKCETCNQTAEVAGRCSACYQGYRRLNDKTPAYLRHYLWKATRLRTRAEQVMEDRGVSRLAKIKGA